MHLAQWARSINRSMMQKMLSLTSRPGILSFALGLPAPELFPQDTFARAVAEVLSADPKALQYGPPFQPLKKHIVDLMAQRGVTCREEQIFLTAGAQQGMSLLARLFLDPGAQVLTEEAIYPGFRQVIEPFQPRIVTAPSDRESGMDVEAVESLLSSGARPAFIYAISDGHNPLAVSLSLEKRHALVELARKYEVPIVEDDAYGFLYYEEKPAAPMRALDDDWVFYVGSFSKILAPSLRVGWLVVPETLLTRL
jgi:2-aminoadipate transaminase